MHTYIHRINTVRLNNATNKCQSNFINLKSIYKGDKDYVPGKQFQLVENKKMTKFFKKSRSVDKVGVTPSVVIFKKQPKCFTITKNEKNTPITGLIKKAKNPKTKNKSIISVGDKKVGFKKIDPVRDVTSRSQTCKIENRQTCLDEVVSGRARNKQRCFPKTKNKSIISDGDIKVGFKKMGPVCDVASMVQACKLEKSTACVNAVSSNGVVSGLTVRRNKQQIQSKPKSGRQSMIKAFKIGKQATTDDPAGIKEVGSKKKVDTRADRVGSKKNAETYCDQKSAPAPLTAKRKRKSDDSADFKVKVSKSETDGCVALISRSKQMRFTKPKNELIELGVMKKTERCSRKPMTDEADRAHKLKSQQKRKCDDKSKNKPVLKHKNNPKSRSGVLAGRKDCSSRSNETPVNIMTEAEPEEYSSEDHDFEENGEGEGSPKTNRRRNRVAIKENWPREVTKLKRQHGEAYIGYERNANDKISHDVLRSQRVMGPRCTSNYCKKSSQRNCDYLLDTDREKLFNLFWDDMTWDQKKVYIVSLVEEHATKSKSVEDSRRTKSLTYFLYIDGKRQQVCKSFFLKTLGLNEWMVLNWVNESDLGIIPAKHILNKRRALVRPPSKLKEFNEKRNQFLRTFFDDLPKMESHYCRHQTDKLYLQPDFESLAQLYEFYVQVCREKNEKPLSDCSFSNLFHSSKLSLYQPKKDRCDLCVSYEAGNIAEEEFKSHIKAKERARKEKDNDKRKAAAGKIRALLMDVQGVKLVPVSNCNSYYFKSKLKMHNFTIFDMFTTDCMNYWWHEGEGGVVASMFVSCIIKHLETYCRDKLPVILYSDGCTYQNRNQVLSNALLNYAMRTGKEVVQKFLVKGHTQMEVDNVHMLIEKKLKKKLINLPEEYISITKKARKSKPLKAVQLTHKDFKNFDDSALYYYPGIRPGTKAGDPTVYDIRSLHYSPTGHISYTLDFDEKPKHLPGKRKIPKSSYLQLKPFYTERPKIIQQKFNDLQDLKRMLPKNVYDFYDNLNH